MKIETIQLRRVEAMPKELEPGVLYVSVRFSTAAHLCACGCGAKVRTPLGPTEWTVQDRSGKPSVWPSIGNWQRPCKSHYIIREGRIIWADVWSDEQILAGRVAEQARRTEYFEKRYARKGWMARLKDWVRRMLG